MKLKLNEIYTREEAGLMSLISTLLKETPHTFQADSAYWDKVELDFGNKVIGLDVSEPIKDKLYYALVGVAQSRDFYFEERM